VIMGAFLGLLQTASPDLAWTTVQRGALKAASAEYDVGITLSAACRDSSFVVAIAGLPPVEGNAEYRKLDVSLRDNTLVSSNWNIAPNSSGSVVVSLAPSVYARRLRATDSFTIRIPAQGETPARRYQLALPSDHTALDAIMASCDVPFENPADAAYDPSETHIIWERTPRITIPSTLPSTDYAEVLVQCSVDGEGRPQDCAVLEERPARSGFARHAIQMVRTGKVRQINGEPIQAGSSFATVMTYRVQDSPR